MGTNTCKVSNDNQQAMNDQIQNEWMRNLISLANVEPEMLFDKLKDMYTKLDPE